MNLAEQLRDHADSFLRQYPDTKDLMTQAADTIEAQSRLLAPAETLAGAAGECRTVISGDAMTRLQDAAQAFIAAQAEYASTGAVPCGECERWKRVDEATLTDLAAIRSERDDLRRQLGEVWKEYDAYKAAHQRNHALDGLRRQLAEAQADNAALAEALSKTRGIFYRDDRSLNRRVEMADWEIGQALSQPHPGAPLLDAVKAIANLLPPTLPAPMPSLPPAWAEDQRLLYKAVATARDAIRNREGRHE